MIKTINIIFVIILFFSYLDFWQGDSTIYHVYAKNISEGKGLVFNDTFSSGATSPLWAVIISTSYLFSNPLIVSKLIGLLFLTGFVLLFDLNVFTSAILFFIAKPAALGYEIPLFFFLVGLLYYGIKNKKQWMIYLSWALIPLARPEGIILLLISQFLYRDYKLLFCLFPFFFYCCYSFLETGYFSTSSASRVEYLFSQGEIYSRRYWFWLLPVIAYVFHKHISIKKWGYAFLLLLIIPIWDSTKAENRIDFNTLSYKGLRISGKVLSYEVTYKYWNKDAEVISMDGITDGKVLSYGGINKMIEKERFDYVIINRCERLRGYEIDLVDYKFLKLNTNKKYEADWSEIWRRK